MRHINLQEWRLLTVADRKVLMAKLGIPRSAPTEVVDNRLVNDGVTERDLTVATLDKLAALSYAPAPAEDVDSAEVFSLMVAAVISNVTLPDPELTQSKEPIYEQGNTEQKVEEASEPAPAKPKRTYTRRNTRKTKEIS